MGEIGVRIFGDDARTLEQIANQLIVFRGNDQCTGLGPFHFISQAGIGQKSDMRGIGIIERSETGYFSFAVTIS